MPFSLKTDQRNRLIGVGQHAFVVKADVDDLALTVNTNTAKEAFAKAVEWHVVNGFGGVSISDGHKRSRSPNFHGRWHRKRLRTRSPPSGGDRFLVDVAISHRARVNRRRAPPQHPRKGLALRLPVLTSNCGVTKVWAQHFCPAVFMMG